MKFNNRIQLKVASSPQNHAAGDCEGDHPCVLTLLVDFALQESGLSAMFVVALQGLNTLPRALVATILCTAASLLTEITSNSAISSVMLPVVFEMVTTHHGEQNNRGLSNL